MPKTRPPTSRLLRDVARRFVGDDPTLRVEPLGAGLINATYRVESAQGSFVLQRINEAVFPAPEHIMSNLARLHALAAARQELGVRLPAPRPANDGAAFVRASDDGIWRMMEDVSPSRTLSDVQNQAQAAEIGRALGRFHRLGSHLDPREMQIALPGFHHTPGYLAALDQALATMGHQANAASADARIADALAFIETRRALVRVLDDAAASGIDHDARDPW